jgi:hypothetical protein
MSHIKIKQKKLPLNYLFVITSVRPSVRAYARNGFMWLHYHPKAHPPAL